MGRKLTVLPHFERDTMVRDCLFRIAHGHRKHASRIGHGRLANGACD